MISGHGNNIYQYDSEKITADFSSNIAYNNHSSKILNFLAGNLDCFCNYPDPMAERLTAQVADRVGANPDQVIITNGSAEAFYLVAHMLSASTEDNVACRTLITTPSFAEYEDSCQLYKHEISYIDLENFDSIDLTNFDSLWLASPNNPDGYRVSLCKIFKTARENEKCKIILDRAYNNLSSQAEYCRELPENVILIESFTKFYGVPGLRLGYIVASAEIIAQVNRMRPPWSVNSLSLVAGEYIISHQDELKINCDELIGESQYLQESIANIGGFNVTPSQCNFFLVEITSGKSAEELYTYLLENYGILIRNASNFRGLTPRHFRIAALERGKNNKLIEALQQWR
ncbi:MAG: aminotransferase class I/II-fold pyridoxal phosphate-dependent enzyme [Rikenellaceae bacterium]